MEELTRELETEELCGARLDLLMSLEVERLSGDQKISAYVLAKRIHAFTDHLMLSILAGFSDVTELAMAINEPEQTVARHKERSDVLEMLPRLSEQLRRGDLDLRRVEVVRERARNLSPELIAEVEDSLVEVAAGLTHSQLARRTTKLVAQADPEGYERRCQKAAQDRRIEIAPLPDGMAKLTAILPAVEARLAHDLLCRDSDSLPTDDRTTDQKRADSFLDRFLGKARERKVQVHVTISMETLMGLTEDPGLLDGYGPISADTARELAMQGPWRGLLLNEYRHVEAMSTERYRPTAQLKEMARVRGGGLCAAPGCTSPIQEIDHHIPWPQGKTSATQLKGYCTWHHHRKHDNYHVTLDHDGSLHWTTPEGRTYTTHPHQY